MSRLFVVPRVSGRMFALALALPLIACGQPHSASQGAPASADVSPPGSEAAANEAADQAGHASAPAFAPRYAGATDESWGSLGPHAGNGTFSTTDSPAQVGAAFARAGQAVGLQPQDMSSDPGLVYKGAGGAGTIAVTAPVLAGVTHVTVNWTTPGG